MGRTRGGVLRHDASGSRADERPKGPSEPGNATPGKPAQTGLCLKHPDRQSQEGRERREAGRSLPGHALKGEPRERARLKDTGETVWGGRRRGTW